MNILNSASPISIQFVDEEEEGVMPIQFSINRISEEGLDFSRHMHNSYIHIYLSICVCVCAYAISSRWTLQKNIYILLPIVLPSPSSTPTISALIICYVRSEGKRHLWMEEESDTQTLYPKLGSSKRDEQSTNTHEVHLKCSI